MDEHEENFKDIFRYTDVEYTPDGYTDVYRWDDFLVIAGDHVYSAMDTIDSVSPGGEYEGFDPQYAYTCEIVGCGDLFDGCALFRPVSHDGEDYIQIAFLRSDIDDSTGEYTERFEAGSFDMPAADALRFDLAVDLMDYFSGRTFEGEPGVSRGLEPREAVAAVEGATGCDLNFFEDFWLGSPGEIVESVHVGPYTKQSLLDFSYYAKELSPRRAARSALPPGPCAHRPARASNATGSTSITATNRSRARSSSGNDIRRPGPSSAWKPARPSTATRPPPVPCTYRRPPSARPSAMDRLSPGSISTMETNRSRHRSSSSRSSPNAARALYRWRPRRGPPRGTRVARTVASGPDARYNRCGR